MSKRKQRQEQAASWLDAANSTPSLEDLTVDGYGLEVAPGQRIVARPIRIQTIVPSPTQPRRVMPSAVRDQWDGQPRSVTGLIETWRQLAADESGLDIDLRDWIERGANEADDDGLERPAAGTLTATLLHIITLAASIYRDGLTNPITVVRQGEGYLLETGERRWLSFHLLNALFPSDGFHEIPARVMDNMSIWRQASENNARADLNAISKARQFALLLMDLYGFENFKSFDVFRHEQDYYAQIADANTYRIPYGTGDKLLNAMGLSHKSAFSRSRALLTLPAEVWRLGDDHNFSEDLLLQLSKLSPADAVKMARKVATRNLSDESQPSQPSKPADDDPFWQKQIDRVFSPQKWSKMTPRERRDAYEYLKAMLIKLEEMGFNR